MKNRILILLCLIPNLATAQAASENVKYLDRTLDYVKQVTSITTNWSNNPEKVEYRKLLDGQIKNYPQIKNDFTLALIDMSVDKEKSIDLLYKLEQVNKNATTILTNFKDKKSLEDPTNVLLNQEIVESEIIPASKELIDAITKLKK